MSDTLLPHLDINNLITEDDTPGVSYSVIHNLFFWLSDEVLPVYELGSLNYRRLPGNWLTEQARQLAEQKQQQAERLIAQWRLLGIEPEA